MLDKNGGEMMNLFIGSTSKEDISKELFDDASGLISDIAAIPKINLVFGAYNKGLMRVSYDEFYKNKKDIIGVVCEEDNTCFDQDYTRRIVTKSPTRRFQNIYENSDVLLFLPGGLGTLAELFSSIEERRINNTKKIIVYNCNYFFTPIVEELYNLYESGFIDEPPGSYIIIESDKEKIIDILKEEL